MEDELRPEDITSANNPPGPPKVSSPSGHVIPSEGRERGTRHRKEGRSPWFGFNLGFLGRGDSDDEAPQGEALVHELHSRIRDSEEQIHELQNQLQEARNQFQEASRVIRAEQETNRRLRRTVKSMESERDNVNVNIKKQEAQIRQVQALAFEGFGSDSWAAGDDGTVRADLENLHSRLKSWAKKYAVGEMSSIKGLALDERESLIRDLAQVARVRPGTQNVIGHLESALMNKKSPAICLQGLISHYVYATIISQPFFALNDACETLQDVYRILEQVNEPESQIWRSKTLRLLATPPPSTQHGDGTQSRYATAQRSVCHDAASKFYNSPAKHLIKPTTGEGENKNTQCFDELESIVQQAGELSTRLWSRRTALSVLSLPQLKDQHFSPRSEILKAHPLHRLFEDDDRCDGWSVGVVAHPAVVGYGSSDGKDYRTGRVWMKAEVWLTEDI